MGKDVKLRFETKDLTVAASGDMAVERGTYQTSWTDKQGKPVTDHGNFVTTWKKVNGQWKVYADMAVPEAPVPGL